MADNASRRGAADLGMPLMVVSFLVIGGFLYWLSLQAAAERELDIVEDSTSMAGDLGAATTVSAADLQTDPAPFEGQLIRIAGLNVASTLGTQGFWLTLPNQNPFLVSMSEGVRAEGLTLTTGQRVTVTGTLYAVNDSILTAWTDGGTIAEADRLAAEFATYFLEAARVEGPGVAGDGGGG